MIANSALLSVLVLMLAVFWVGGETTFLTPYKRLLFTQYGVQIGLFLLVVFINLFAVFYLLTRALFLKDTGRKLAHVEKQLRTGDSIVHDLSARLAEED